MYQFMHKGPGNAEGILGEILKGAIEEIMGPVPEPTRSQKVAAFFKGVISTITILVTIIPLIVIEGIKQGVEEAKNIVDPWR